MDIYELYHSSNFILVIAKDSSVSYNCVCLVSIIEYLFVSDDKGF